LREQSGVATEIHSNNRKNSMSLIENAKKEFEKSPVAVITGASSAVLTVVSLLAAYIQSKTSANSIPPTAGSIPAQLEVANLLLICAFFLSSTLTFAWVVSLLARTHKFAALILSLIVAVFSAFGTLLVLHLIPPRPLNPNAVSLAQDLTLWGTYVIFMALNGLSLLRELAGPNPKPSKEGSDALSWFFAVAIVLIIWTQIVSGGVSKLVAVFLT
jgi:hypothetical protein